MMPLQFVSPEEQQEARNFIAAVSDHDLLSYYLRTCSFALSTAVPEDPLYGFYVELVNTCYEKVKSLPRPRPYLPPAEKILFLSEIVSSCPANLQEMAQLMTKVKMRANAAASLLNAPPGHEEKLESFFDHCTEELRKYLNL